MTGLASGTVLRNYAAWYLIEGFRHDSTLTAREVVKIRSRRVIAGVGEIDEEVLAKESLRKQSLTIVSPLYSEQFSKVLLTLQRQRFQMIAQHHALDSAHRKEDPDPSDPIEHWRWHLRPQ